MIPSLKLDAVPWASGRPAEAPAGLGPSGSGPASTLLALAVPLLTPVLPAPASAAAADPGDAVDPAVATHGADTADPAAATHAADTADAARERAAEVAAMLRLAATEYAEAVRDGEVVNEAEYAESREFTARAAAHFAPLREAPGAGDRAGAGPGDAEAAVAARLDSLVAVVEAKGPGERYRELAERVSGTLERAWGAVPVPEPVRRPSAPRGERLYGQACAACHGPSGRGDGWAAEGMTPAPPDLADPARGEEASPARDYLVIQHGIPETAMPSHRDWLSVGEAWDLVAYLRELMETPLEDAPGD